MKLRGVSDKGLKRLARGVQAQEAVREELGAIVYKINSKGQRYFSVTMPHGDYLVDTLEEAVETLSNNISFVLASIDIDLREQGYPV